MNADRWQQVKTVFDRAVERDAASRAEFVRELCGNDAGLQREVESLLASDQEAGSLLEDPLLAGAGALKSSVGDAIASDRLHSTRIPLSAGTRLGPYEILAPIGAGGMGEVYQARDTRLQRDVAIKVSAQRFSERFEREARAIASLNHPNICTLYDVGPNYLVMELVEGPTLAERIKQGAVPMEEALPIARQMAEALDAAHEKGIVHRDLKPANIKIKPGGTVKVLDFGLAKVAPVPAGELPREDSPIVSMGFTQAGMILGTAAYMAPEQAKGKPVDKRADIWAFGVVLYEMLAGRKLFAGEDISETLAAVIKEEPKWDAVPARARQLLQRCLEKDPKQRLRDIGDAMPLLREPMPEDDAPRSNRGQRGALWPALAVVLAAAFWGLGLMAYRRLTEDTRVLKLSVTLPKKATFAGTTSDLAVSPDGRSLVFVASTEGKVQLWVRDLDSFSARPLPGTEGGFLPFWSPDSRTVAFQTLDAGGNLKRVDVAGGPAVNLREAPYGYGGTWAQDGSEKGIILFAPNRTGGLFRVPATGGTPTSVTELDQTQGELLHAYPWFLPDGRHFLYTVVTAEPGNSAVYVGDLNSKTRQRLVAAASNAVYAAPGYLLFLRFQTLMAQPFDAGQRVTTGDAFPIAEQVDYFPADTWGAFSASQSGVLAYSSGASTSAQLTWFDRSGTPLGTVGDPGFIEYPAISPDGNTVAYSRRDPQTGTFDIWLHDLVRGTDSKFTFNSKDNRVPVWSPDGNTIAFSSNRDGVYRPYRKASNGSAPADALNKDGIDTFAGDWSRDGRYLVEGKIDPKTKYDIWVLPLTPDEPGDRKSFPYLQTEFNEHRAKLSPNGQWLAYMSDETKRNEVYVRTFPNPSGKWTASINGGDLPVWSRNGEELYFIGADGKMMVVEVKNSVNFERSAPKPLFDARLAGDAWFDVSKDGRFLIPARAEQTANGTMSVVVNWTSGIKK